MTNSIYILIIAALLDYLIGDPWNWPHPVQVMGWVISLLSKFFLELCKNSLTQRLAGIVLGIILIIGSGLVGFLIIQSAKWVHPLLGIAIDSILLASCFAGRSLRAAAVAVLHLSQAEISRAVLETVAENATDGVMAPLFYAIVGVFVPVVGATPLALAYKASSTLDSMVGYREAPYTYLGWFCARLEDCLTWLPCRLTVVTLALLSGKPMHLWRICRRDAIKDPSPNSGWSECAYATFLGVQMGGTNWYRGVAKYKPLLGDAIYPITATSIQNALQLTRYCFLLWLGIAIAIFLILANR